MFKPRYTVTLKISFASEKEMETALEIFTKWSAKRPMIGKKYGFVRKDQNHGELFFTTPTGYPDHLETIKLQKEIDQVTPIRGVSFEAVG